MVSLSKKEIEEEIIALKEAITAHEQVKILQEKGIKINTFELQLFEAELEKFK